MNRKLKTLMTVTLACLMFCGTALAAPRGGRGRPSKPAPKHHVERHRPAPKRHVRKCRPAPPPKHHKVRHHHRHCPPPRAIRCCRFDYNVIDCLCCLPGQRVVIWR